MTAKRFTHKINQLGMQFICYDDKAELLGTFADAEGVTHIVKLLNELHEENKQLLQSTQNFLHAKLTDCETLFEQANANSDIIYMKGMLEIGGIQTQLIANIGKRQAYQEVLEFIRKEQME